MRHAMTTKNDFLIQLVALLYSDAKYKDCCHLGGHLGSFHASLNCQESAGY